MKTKILLLISLCSISFAIIFSHIAGAVGSFGSYTDLFTSPVPTIHTARSYEMAPSGQPVCELTDLTDTFYGELFNDDEHMQYAYNFNTGNYVTQSQYDDAKLAYQNALERGYGWSISQYYHPTGGSSSKNGYFTWGDGVLVSWTDSDSAYLSVYEFTPYAPQYDSYISQLANHDGAPVYSVFIGNRSSNCDVIPALFGTINGDTDSEYPMSLGNPIQIIEARAIPPGGDWPSAFSFNQVFLVAMPSDRITWPGDPGTLPPSVPVPATFLPQFGYTIRDKDLSLLYLRNLPDDILSLENSEYQHFSITIHDSDDSWNDLGPIESFDFNVFDTFNFTFPDYGYYYFTISHHKDAPSLPSEVDPVTYRVYVDGEDHIGGGTNPCDEFGNCDPPPVNCNKGDYFQKYLCHFKQQMKVGLLNPSLLAVRSFINDLIVDEPACVLHLDGFSYMGSTFDPSDYDTIMCTETDKIHDNFPFIAVVANGLYAVTAIAVLASMVNRLLSAHSTNLLEIHPEVPLNENVSRHKTEYMRTTSSSSSKNRKIR